MNVTTTALTTANVWRFNPRASENCRAAVLASGNGTTNFGEVAAGTVLADIGSGKLRPAAFQQATVLGSAANTMTVHDARGFFVGDSIIIVQGTSVEDSAVIVAGDDPSNLTVTARPSTAAGLKIDIVVAGTGTAFSHSYDTATHKITVNSATGGGGAATTTVGDVADVLNSVYGSLCSAVAATDADLVVDVGPTTLSGRSLAGGLIAQVREVTAVAKVVGITNTITFDGAAATWGVDDLILGYSDGGPYQWRPVGVLNSTTSTVRYVGTTEVVSEQDVSVALEGDARSTALVGHCDAMNRALAGGNFTGPDGALHISPFPGFTVRAV